MVAAAFGMRLRAHGLSTSPAEVIEVRRVLGLLGARDRGRLAAGLRATCVKYGYEDAGFEAAFTELFDGASAAAAASGDDLLRAGLTGALPDDLELAEEAELARYADYNERAAEVGEMFDTPEAEKGFNPHKGR